MKDQSLINNLKQFASDIHHTAPIKAIILFGSQARGDFSPFSDIDIMVIGEFKGKFFDRGDFILERFPGKRSVDLFCYTPSEFDEMFKKGIISILDAIDEGICLIGNEFFNKYRDKLRILKQRGLKKDPPVWVLPKSMIT